MPVPVCRVALQRAQAKSEAALKAYQSSNLQDQKSFDAHLRFEEQADRDYRACFAQHLREQPNYAAILKQAQALVDLLH